MDLSKFQPFGLFLLVLSPIVILTYQGIRGLFFKKCRVYYWGITNGHIVTGKYAQVMGAIYLILGVGFCSILIFALFTVVLR